VHEVLPVTAGYRLALVYNLVRPGRGALPEPPHYAAQEKAVAELLRRWTGGLRSPDGGEPQKLIYPLEHVYTPAELSFQALKGADDGIARVVAVPTHTMTTQRDRHLAAIAEHGRIAWQRCSGYSRRSLVETAMYRYKTIIGRRLHARILPSQRTEAKIACNVVNRMTSLGMPLTGRVA
jgi:hypothetical protein